ncbi:6-O-methylguanine-DNA methyltransferase [Staphylococcus gallinarum]|uniref:methylated-DNA--[protein]-cysteine S-methyltransferase n=1 Tax=Staphylococcus gallinarum TaxID=1293 RepID=A0A380FNJ3_STAGA|nr:6-O-methylguanine-DNA methyltransferase [Staphylococcus gallinarum]
MGCQSIKTLNKQYNETLREAELPVFDKVSNWLNDYFSGNNPEINFPLAPEGTEFRKRVWNLLLKIPYGETVTYGDIAQDIARQLGKEKMSSQAIGGAVGSNPISIIIPCHRVVGKDGNLTGYGGGIDTKIALFKIEQMNMANYYRPKFSTKP